MAFVLLRGGIGISYVLQAVRFCRCALGRISFRPPRKGAFCRVKAKCLTAKVEHSFRTLLQDVVFQMFENGKKRSDVV